MALFPLAPRLGRPTGRSPGAPARIASSSPRLVRVSASSEDRPRWPGRREEPSYDSGEWRSFVTENFYETEETKRQREALEAERAAYEAKEAAARALRPQARVTDSMRQRAAGFEDDDRFGDFLFELGQSDQSSNTTVGAREGMIDSKFVGEFLGKDSDIASGELRRDEVRKLDNLQGDWYICPDFMDAVVIHMAKNLLYDQGSFPGTPKVPLILGIWGGKGMGKSFQTELIMRKLGATPIIMSAGELESVEAGRPGRLIRERYRAASNVIGVHGKMSALIINDLDAGCGRFKNTQVTVNNQIVMGTLMNLCDAPNEVSVGERWREDQWLNRVPIIVTGNDFSTLYAPLIRDGRMDKFFWDPSRHDIVSMLEAMFRDDDITRDMVGDLVDAFPGQSMDFFGSMKCRMYDASMRQWVLERAGAAQGTPIGELSDEQLNTAFKGIANPRPGEEPMVNIPKVTFEMLMDAGRDLVQEQAFVNEQTLSLEYLNNAEHDMDGGSIIGLSG